MAMTRISHGEDEQDMEEYLPPLPPPPPPMLRRRPKRLESSGSQEQDRATTKDEIALPMPADPEGPPSTPGSDRGPSISFFWLKHRPKRPVFWDLAELGCSKEEFTETGLKLYKAALRGDWADAKEILSEDPKWFRQPITEVGDTVLHVAVANKRTCFVKSLVRLIDKDNDLIIKNKNKDTAFNLAAASGVIRMAKVLATRYQQFLYIRGNKNRLPLHMAVLARHRDMAWYLLSITILDDEDGLPYNRRMEILMASIRCRLFDITAYLLKKTPEFSFYRDSENEETVLHALAQQPLESRTYYQGSMWKTLTRLGSNLIQGQWLGLTLEEEIPRLVWEQIFNDSEPDSIGDVIGYPVNLLFEAAKTGNVKVLAPIIRTYPDVVLRMNEEGHTIFHIAITNRQQEIFELIHEVGANKDWISTQVDYQRNTMLHLAAKRAPDSRLNRFPGAALQMQIELIWFKAVEGVVGPDTAEILGGYKMKPRELFTKEHEKLRKDGEGWMKKTAESCTLVASLITTVAFAAAFTPPGGTAGDSGKPFLLNRPIFIAFAICNAISLFSSSASILVFLFILTSRYEEDEFLSLLPLRLMLGLTMLFVSIAAMMGAFTTTFFITFRKGDVSWLPIPIALLAVIPVSLFVCQQYPLLVDVYKTTYGSTSLSQPGKPRIFQETSTKKRS